jgi:hypothetical protein
MSRRWQRLWAYLAILALVVGAGLISPINAHAQSDTGKTKITFWNY